ncbi:MAG: hypothetical protein ABIP51_03275 [Bacteroidia bacterium]
MKKKNPTGAIIVALTIAAIMYAAFPFEDAWNWNIKVLFSLVVGIFFGVFSYLITPREQRNDKLD